MYAQTPDHTRLLQGDVVGDILLIGALNPRSIAFQTAPFGDSAPRAWTVPSSPKLGPAMVLSHSCEIAVENEAKQSSIILAPIRDVSTASPADRRAQLIESNRIDDGDGEWSYLKYFYLEPSPELAHDEGSVVDFSFLFSIRWRAFEYVLERKILQLADDVRTSMALKLALYFYREHDDAA